MSRTHPLLPGLLLALACTLAPLVALAADAKSRETPAPVSAPAAAKTADAPANNSAIHAEKMRADKKALVANNMALTENEAKGFWPLYDEYQKSQADLSRRNIQVIAAFLEVQKKGSVDGAVSEKLIDDMLAAEQAEVDMRKSFVPRLSKVLPPLKVARYLQIEGKVNAAVRAQLAPRIPLVGSAPSQAK